MLEAFPDITSIDDLSDFINLEPGHIFVMMPYPELTEKERREITNYYAFHFIRTYADLQSINELIHADNNLLNILEKETGN